MVVIIGAGLSGLLIAYRLKEKGVPVKLIEARDRVGGRIFTKNTKGGFPVEMGATWFSKDHKNLIRLLKELQIDSYEQFMQGMSYYQALSTAPAEGLILPNQSASYRIAGGTSYLIEKLVSVFSEEELFLNQEVKRIQSTTSGVRVVAKDIFEADKVIVCAPPKLVTHKIQFEPKLSEELIGISQETQTWMEGSIKVALTFDTPFWREKELSGCLFSNVGPITEFYDHSNYDNTKYALCGFMSPVYERISKEERILRVVTQLKNVFGSIVESYVSYEELIWKDEAFTSDQTNFELFPHQNNGHDVYQESYYDGKLYFSNTETSPRFSGYMEGAVHAANLMVGNYGII